MSCEIKAQDKKQNDVDTKASKYDASVKDVGNGTTKQCICVDCGIDNDCGDLWKGGPTSNYKIFDTFGTFDKITVVISHCEGSLFWLRDFLDGSGRRIPTNTNIDINIFSKCGKPVRDAPIKSKIYRLPNLGRCDHTYAYYMNKMYNSSDLTNEVILFMKDMRTIHQQGKWMKLLHMFRNAHRRGFGCGMVSTRARNISKIHETDKLVNYTMKDYNYSKNMYQDIHNTGPKVPFISDFIVLKDYMNYNNYSFPERLTEACYGGVFAATRRAIQKQPRKLWQSLEKSLRRGDNIVEGHFVERSWAGLLTDPLKDYQMTALEKAANRTLVGGEPTFGALIALKYRQKRRFRMKNRLISPKTPNGDLEEVVIEFGAESLHIFAFLCLLYLCMMYYVVKATLFGSFKLAKKSFKLAKKTKSSETKVH